MRVVRSSGPWLALSLLAACSGGGGTGDASAPAAPTLSSQPPSPSNRTDPTLVGYTRPGATLSVYAGAGCVGTPLASVHIGVDGGFAVKVTVAPGSTTEFSAAASIDGKASPCGPVFTYVVDGDAPGAPAAATVTPASPSNVDAPVVSGTTEPLARVAVFADATCAGSPLGTAPAAGADGAFSVTVHVPHDATTTFGLEVTDFAGNTSGCFPGPVYVQDATPPEAPLLAATAPASPANAASVSVSGTAEALATIRLHAGTCAEGPIVGTGPVAADGAFAVDAAAARNQANTIVAEAVDAAGNVSPCSDAIVFVEDSTAPAVPALASAPANDVPRNAATIVLSGAVEAGATVTVYRGAACDAEVGRVVADVDGTFALEVAVDRNASTTFSARAADALGNASPCGAPLAFVEDSTPPAAPVASATVPASPSSDLAPVLAGIAEPAAVVRVYGDAGCTGAAGVLGEGVAGPDGAFAVTIAAPRDAATALHLDATDGAGNTSACASGPLYVQDSTPPAAPILAGTVPGSPANAAAVSVVGSAEPGAVVTLHAGGCGGAFLGVAQASAIDGQFAAAVTVDRNQAIAIYADARDAVGNASACSAPIGFVEDSTPPAGVVLAATPGSPSSASAIVISGATEPGARVQLYRGAACDAELLPAPAVDATGRFSASVAIPQDPPDATLPFTARATDAAGNSTCGPALTFVHDLTPPASPVASGTTPASPANDNDPVLSGTAEPGATVRVYAGGGCAPAAVLATATAGANGAFAVTFHVANDTTTAVELDAADAAGNRSACAAGPIYVEDSTAPGAPVVLATAPASPANTAVVDVRGTAEPGAEVVVFAGACGGPFLGTGTASGAGTFTVGVSVARDATTELVAQAVDAAGNVSGCSTALAFVQDSTLPAAPALGSSPSSAHPQNVARTGGTIVLSGTVEPGATVSIFRGAACETPVAAPVVAADGAFSATVAVDANATTVFTARATDPAGNVSPCGPTLAFVEDSLRPAAPVATATTPAGPANDNDPVLSGVAEGGATVRVYGDPACAGPVLGAGAAGGGGAYAVSFHVADDTTTALAVTATDAAGNVSDCVPGPIYVEDSTPPARPALASVTPGSPANTAAVTVAGNAEAGAGVTLFGGGCGGTFLGGGSAAGDGSFVVSATIPRNAATSIFAQARDAAGNASACSDALVFVEDSTPPAAPGLSSSPPSDHARNVSAAGGTIALAGTTEPTATVNVYRDGTCGSLLGPAPVAADGSFSLVVPVDPNATTTFSARATDAADNASSCGTPLAFVEDSIAPAAPVLTDTAAAFPTGPTSNAGPTFSGTAEAKATVQIFTTPGCAAGTLVSTGVASAAGAFSIPVPVPQDTTTTFGANAVDAAGNVSPCTAAPRPYVHDGTPPAFAGLATVTVRDAGSIRLTWQAATDAVTTQDRIVYDVCRSTSWGGCTGGTFTATPPSVTGGTGTITYDVTGLSPGTRYFFVVRAHDQAGNADRNVAQKMGKTFGNGAVATASGGNGVPAASGGTPYFTCVLDGGGRVLCLSQTAGIPQLGTGGSAVTGPVVGLPPAVAISAGESHACALAQDGAIYCWGANDGQQVGIDPAVNAGPFSTAQRVSTGASTPAVAIDCGRAHTCALLADGSIRCWGKDDQGQLGNGAQAARSGVVQVPAYLSPLDGRVVAATGIAAGDQHSCAAYVDGSVRCWGARTHGQLGDGTALVPAPAPALAPVPYPAPLDAFDRYVSVDAGWTHTCALTLKGKIYCAGANGDGQIGDGSTSDRIAPFPVGLAQASRLTLGRNHTCAIIAATGEPWCWGDDAFGQMGDRGNADRKSPALANGSFTGWKAFFAGQDETCGVKNGQAYCWGTGGSGLNPAAGGTTLSPLLLNGAPGATALAAGRAHTCAMLADGAVRCFGSNSAGQVGNGQPVNALLPADVASGAGAVVAGGANTCFGTVSGATCWGSNEFLQLGDPTFTGPIRNLPPGGLARPDWPVAIGDHACGANPVGALECWGRNDRGQLGRNTTGDPTASSAAVGGGGFYVRGVTVGALHACAIDRDGAVSCWGDNGSGQLGTAGAAAALSPVPVSVYGLTEDVVQIDAGGGDTTCARDAGGGISCWGANAHGQLGDPSNLAASSDAAAPVAGLANAIDLAVGPNHACAVLAEGTVRCWGSNASGQLGDGGTSDSATPVVAAGVTGARQVVVGETHSCALLGDGTARCWGGNLSGQLGDGTTTAHAVPAPVEAFP
ncbi:Ig-like domain-containing protein [Anaeromyxobacter oryzae]|uniref:Fibronectin type-III domain-containing protein n=1 Tax=Anaeromyxobacter oryzae TaxID=2918170 RepID=A0ABM7WQI9_9BACT|nr:Ig-like domain-containing protein [Anaeromyxobacter oryzae]BDG01729.1 hypothetical protein AMOR_07250 [Anaeromyxobacter oryzae]